MQDLSKLRDIQGITWDLDGCVYKIIPEHLAAFREACGVIMTDILEGQITLDEALALVGESTKQHGNWSREFELRYGVKTEDWFFKLFDTVDDSALAVDETLKHKFNMLGGFGTDGFSHVLNTQTSCNRAVRVLERFGIRDHFKTIIGYETVNFRSKATHRDSHELSVAAHGLPALHLAMAEDTAKNLVIPKEMGKTTILIHFGKPPERPLSYIDYQFATPREALDAVISAKKFG